jgi:hypothetical protein
MMSEFWAPSPHRAEPAQRFFVKQAASAAHIYGRRLVGAEAFTTVGKHWDDVMRCVPGSTSHTCTRSRPRLPRWVCPGRNTLRGRT